ncbi:MAG: chromosomal replication initiator protein DnaA [Planctomycetota bacterium]
MKQQAPLWSKTLQQIRTSVGKSRYNALFSDIYCSSFTKDEIKISVPNESRKNVFGRQYHELIGDAIRKLLGWSPRLTVSVDGEECAYGEEESSLNTFFLETTSETENDLWTVPLNPDYTFDNFVVGRCNQLAHAAAIAITESLGKLYNPFFVHSAVGMGKTHILQAVCHEIKKKDPSKKILYISSEVFVNRFIRAIEKGEIESLRYQYKDVDVLAVDDTHFFANKERTQEEFFHTFNNLYHLQKQIILSSDSPPKEIPLLQERLVTRFNWGLVARIEPPEYETRISIVKKKAYISGYNIPDNVAQYIAETVISNVRELEGAVVCVLGVSSLTDSPVSIELAQEALKDNFIQKPKIIKLSNIIEAVANRFNVKETDICGKRRLKSIVIPRQICMFLARKYTSLSLEEIGTYFGGRDHSTVLHSIEKVKNNIEVNPTICAILSDIEKVFT